MSEIDSQMAEALAYMRERTKLREGQVRPDMNQIRKNVIEDFAYWNENPPALYSVEDIKISGAFGDSAVRHYVPEKKLGATPALIHFHGGGWIVGGLDLEDRFLRELSLESGLDILSVDYVLAPEHKHPEPLNDCVAICLSIIDKANDLAIDPLRLSLSGSSAGANLALATALSLRDANKNLLNNILLFYGVFNAGTDSPSHVEFADDRYSPGGPGMDAFLQSYLTDQSDRTNPLVSPLLADLAKLPPCYLCIAELDSLRDDSIQLEAKLRAAKVETESNLYHGVIHGFTTMSRAVDIAKVAIVDAANFLKKHL